MNTTKSISIVKASGENVPYDENKIVTSLLKAGVSNLEIQDILLEVKNFIYDGISTKEIYLKAYSYLQETLPSNAGRYRLKMAIFELGPTGYPFERFIGELLTIQGYKTNIGVILKGHCVKHEVDVVASKEDTHILIECKFHTEQSRICDVKIPLYINSRFEDIAKEMNKDCKSRNLDRQGWIVTNTRFSEDAMRYGNCVGLNLISWDHPRNNSLKVQIEKNSLYPITCLTTLTTAEKQKLIQKDKILCRDIIKQPILLQNIGIKNKNRQNTVMKELNELCNYNQTKTY